MREFMPQEMTACGCVRLVLAGSKSDVAPDGVSTSANRLSGGPGSQVRMHAYPGEVMTEARFHHGARCGIKRLSRRANDFMHDRWWKRRLTHTRGVPLQHHRFLSALAAFAAARVLAARALPLEQTANFRI
jgi:hypothetical protein